MHDHFMNIKDSGSFMIHMHCTLPIYMPKVTKNDSLANINIESIRYKTEKRENVLGRVVKVRIGRPVHSASWSPS